MALSISMATPTSPDRASMLSLCFPEDITNDGVIVDPTEMIDGVVPHDEYCDEMDMMTDPPIPELLEDDSSLFDGTISPVEGASNLVDPPLSFDVLLGFVSRSDDVSVASFMDLRDVETVDFGTEDQPRELKISPPLSTDDRDRLIHLLKSYLDVFAWSYEDMPGLDPSIVQHHLPILPHARSVKQKLRLLHPRWSLQDGKVRVCVDFRDLNKASPKNDFPLPHIDLLVDSTAGHSMLSFMAGFSGYNQILMAPEDMEKTAFITEWRADHLEALERFFERIRKFRLRLNPKKCTFEVTSGRLLGHMVSEWGIEVDPGKIKAILDMPAPKTEKEIRGFMGRLQYISRFIARLTDIYMALGCMLAQIDDSGKERTIYYLSKRMLEYEVKYKSIKGSIVADHLASLPTSKDRPIDDDFPDEEFVAMTSLSGWYMYFDGAAISQVLRQIQGDWKTRDVKLRPYHAYLELLVARFDDLRYVHLPRAQNRFVDALATLASSVDILIDVIVRLLLIELRSGTYPEIAIANDRRALRNLATRFVICGDTLYRRSADDCCQFVQKCPECQIHGDLIHAPPSELHTLTSPWPFSVWGIDIIGKVSPKSSSGHEFILVSIDYFTKWGGSRIICEKYGIRHHKSSAYRLQTNGAVEAANKNIKRILRKMVETSRDWSEKLPFALWAYHTSFRTSTGATPYSLVYCMEVVFPVKTKMGSLRVALEQQISEMKWAQARFDQLNLLDEKRLRATDHIHAYQRKMTHAFRKRVKPRPLQKGDLVLRILRGLIGDPRGKFRPSWSGLMLFES
ncbi:Retrovirus-related Pol polyprotein from transposon 297 [Vitis vinifera]|uniref:Retrovirus-related Pol polyprotein from transposon 297 n=1 Tax=Vitis vinifera TaxID=29760 RepID=A0A438GFT2_VITVI|nr:Retrovirus-related Pol polyprotein from transposon 297 [Vitis vinifera]